MPARSSTPEPSAGSRRVLRLGGRAVLPGGEVVVWSIADGRRGRRWREVTSLDGSVLRAVLLETDPAGRVVRLELSTAAGLLTLHPDRDGAVLHGNVVTPGGVRHLTLDEAVLFIAGSPAAAAVALGRLSGQVAVGGAQRVDVIRIDDRLEPGEGSWDVTRLEERTWRLVSAGDGEVRSVRLDGDGLAELPDGEAWPLEL
jgi:hypothetical protein